MSGVTPEMAAKYWQQYSSKRCGLELPGCPKATSIMFKMQKFDSKDTIDVCSNCWAAFHANGKPRAAPLVAPPRPEPSAIEDFEGLF